MRGSFLSHACPIAFIYSEYRHPVNFQLKAMCRHLIIAGECTFVLAGISFKENRFIFCTT